MYLSTNDGLPTCTNPTYSTHHPNHSRTQSKMGVKSFTYYVDVGDSPFPICLHQRTASKRLGTIDTVWKSETTACMELQARPLVVLKSFPKKQLRKLIQNIHQSRRFKETILVQHPELLRSRLIVHITTFFKTTKLTWSEQLGCMPGL